ncbi:MAG: DNA polymerase III subunit delta' [Rhodobacteraceae bacterium]|nr:DNA polymerase III subunit delta' [Paracoccaceae bacterium]
MSDEAPDPDRVEGAPHPRDTVLLRGQAAAEAAFLDAVRTGRMHHGWLLTGPRGVGKATLAWRLARFLLAEAPADAGLFGAPPPPETLDIPPDHPIARRVAAQSEGRLKLIRRTPDEKTGRLRSVITVDDVRGLKSFFHLSAADGGRRIVIVDPVDEMNPNAANALLKELEEPPKDAVLLLISHQPWRLLPTIRSRCRELRLSPLGPQDMAVALAAAGAEGTDAAALSELAAGSVGEAIRLANLDGVASYAALVALFAGIPRMERPKALALADSAGARGAEARFDLMLTLIETFLARAARTGALGAPPPEAVPDEAALLMRLAPDPAAGRGFADLQQTLGARARRGKAVNLDPATLLLDMVLKIDETAGTLGPR